MQALELQPENPTTNNIGIKPEKRCYTVEDLMGILGVGRKAVYSLIRKKAFPAIRINRADYRIPKESFLTWMYQQ